MADQPPNDSWQRPGERSRPGKTPASFADTTPRPTTTFDSEDSMPATADAPRTPYPYYPPPTDSVSTTSPARGWNYTYDKHHRPGDGSDSGNEHQDMSASWAESDTSRADSGYAESTVGGHTYSSQPVSRRRDPNTPQDSIVSSQVVGKGLTDPANAALDPHGSVHQRNKPKHRNAAIPPLGTGDGLQAVAKALIEPVNSPQQRQRSTVQSNEPQRLTIIAPTPGPGQKWSDWVWSDAHKDHYCSSYDSFGQPIYIWAKNQSKS